MCVNEMLSPLSLNLWFSQLPRKVEPSLARGTAPGGCFRKASPRRGRGTVAPATVEGGLPQNCPTIFCKWLRKLYCLCTKSSLARGTPSVFGYASASSPIRWSLSAASHPLYDLFSFPFAVLFSPFLIANCELRIVYCALRIPNLRIKKEDAAASSFLISRYS